MDPDNSEIERIIRTREERASVEEICLTINDCPIAIITAINDAQILIINANATASRLHQPVQPLRPYERWTHGCIENEWYIKQHSLKISESIRPKRDIE